MGAMKCMLNRAIQEIGSYVLEQDLNWQWFESLQISGYGSINCLGYVAMSEDHKKQLFIWKQTQSIFNTPKKIFFTFQVQHMTADYQTYFI
jgi:hypothetical protein